MDNGFPILETNRDYVESPTLTSFVHLKLGRIELFMIFYTNHIDRRIHIVFMQKIHCNNIFIMQKVHRNFAPHVLCKRKIHMES
jgi:hypothetical protein